MPVQFEEKTVKYRFWDEETDKYITGSTNKHTWQLMKNRYVVLRDFLPKEIIDMAMDMWRSDEEFGNAYLKTEKKDITYKNPLSSIGKSDGGYCTPWGIALQSYIHKKLKDYIDMDLRETYSYTRKYVRGAYLGSHTDRPSCEISATLCLDYLTDDNTPWPIWVRNDKNYAGVDAEIVKNDSQDIPQRLRKKNNCKSVSLEPGDILLYQGPNIPHWRDYLLGEYSYHLFVHFFNADSKMCEIEGFNYGIQHDVNIGPNSNNQKYALDLDGRKNRFSNGRVQLDFNTGEEMRTSSPKQKAMQEFSDNYYNSDYGKYVNNFDHLERVEKK
jgi:hypothetical protein